MIYDKFSDFSRPFSLWFFASFRPPDQPKAPPSIVVLLLEIYGEPCKGSSDSSAPALPLIPISRPIVAYEQFYRIFQLVYYRYFCYYPFLVKWLLLNC